ncbi:MAG: hypothetical protein ACJAZO_002799 [Myxococcota bacterium]|jgi:hypothetical protein
MSAPGSLELRQRIVEAYENGFARQLPSDQMSSLPAESTLTSNTHWSLNT